MLWIVQGLIELSADEEHEQSYALPSAVLKEGNSAKRFWTRPGFSQWNPGLLYRKNKIFPMSLNYRAYFNCIDAMPQTHNNSGVSKYGGTRWNVYVATDFFLS